MSRTPWMYGETKVVRGSGSKSMDLLLRKDLVYGTWPIWDETRFTFYAINGPKSACNGFVIILLQNVFLRPFGESIDFLSTWEVISSKWQTNWINWFKIRMYRSKMFEKVWCTNVMYVCECDVMTIMGNS